MPMYEPAPLLPDRKQTERDFFKSRSYLKKHYRLDLAVSRSLPYPYNILMAGQELQNKLKTKGRHRELSVIGQEDGQICLTVRETLNQYLKLHYIPVMPLYGLWQNPQHLQCAELLTAVCAYLYIEAGLPYYRDEGTYLYYNYEVLEDWIDDDQGGEDGDGYRRQKAALADARSQGIFIQEKMLAPGFRQSLDYLILAFQAVTGFEKDCLKAAKDCLAIWKSYPGADFFKHADLPNDEAGDDDEDYVPMNEYISFIGSTNDMISDSLLDMANSDFNERARCQEPATTTSFDEPKPVYANELAYVESLFKLIDDLCGLLNRKP